MDSILTMAMAIKEVQSETFVIDKSIKTMLDKNTVDDTCDLKQRLSNNQHNNHVEDQSLYDKLLPKNEFGFMAPIRRWEKNMGFLTPLKWMNVIYIILLHVISVTYFLWCIFFTGPPMWQTLAFGFAMWGIAGFGVTAGAHRYYCHRSFKAKLPLQIILLLCYSVAGQNNIFEWVRDHRVHHKFSETSADPHDVSRGFFFAHVGWLMMKKHPDVLKEGAKVDMSDIVRDPLVKFHTRYFTLFKFAFCIVLPTLVPVFAWNESWRYAILSQMLLRYMFTLNCTWAVNSFAHLWGNKPYDRFINPVENWAVSIVALGEGWHNYHHTFPWDYKSSELAYFMNWTTFLLDIFAKIGWAYDMKQASPSLIKAVIQNRGNISEN